MPIPAGLTREHILRAIADIDAKRPHRFGSPTGYELHFKGKRYPPKAVVGLACRYLNGQALSPGDFQSGVQRGQAVYVLRELGFNVEPIREGRPDVPQEHESRAGSNWTSEEVRLLVADYFEMLAAELSGRKYRKSAHRQALARKISSRSNGSIEFKHQNVSGVLVERGLPYIEGYKPRLNYQELLAAEVEAYLERHPGLLERLADSPGFNPDEAPPIGTRNLDDVIEDPPERIVTPLTPAKPWLSRRGRKVDFAERDAANHRLGALGEQFVFEYERRRLIVAGRDDLADRVQWAAQSIGDGLGFDILSFDETDESERFLEVKTTGLGKFFPFYVTGNEVRCSEDVPEQFRLFRVFDFGRKPRIYILSGSLSCNCQLEPALYRALPAVR